MSICFNAVIDDKTPPKLAEILRDTWPQLLISNKHPLNRTTDTSTQSLSETEDSNSSETTKQ